MAVQYHQPSISDSVQVSEVVEEETVKVHEGYENPEADFTLISSDGVSFNIQKYYLLANSSVLGTLISSLDSEPTIEFTDEVIEHSQTIKLFLDLLTSKPPQPTKSVYDRILPCYDLAIKYDCLNLVTLIKSFAATLLGVPQVTPDYMFIFASHINDKRLAAEAIRRGHTRSYRIRRTFKSPYWHPTWLERLNEANIKEDDDQNELDQGVARTMLMDVSAWPV